MLPVSKVLIKLNIKSLLTFHKGQSLNLIKNITNTKLSTECEQFNPLETQDFDEKNLLLENPEEMFSLYHMDSDVIDSFNILTTHWCVTCCKRVNIFYINMNLKLINEFFKIFYRDL